MEDHGREVPGTFTYTDREGVKTTGPLMDVDPTGPVFVPSVTHPAVGYSGAAAGMQKEQAAQTKQNEIRVVDPKTGGEKGSKLQRFCLIPRDFIWALAQHYGQGAKKYADRNWERGYAWGLTVDAHDRHLGAWIHGTPENGWVPEDNDPETGSSHLICAIWHLVALWWFHRYGRGTDNVRHTIGPVNAFAKVVPYKYPDTMQELADRNKAALAEEKAIEERAIKEKLRIAFAEQQSRREMERAAERAALIPRRVCPQDNRPCNCNDGDYLSCIGLAQTQKARREGLVR